MTKSVLNDQQVPLSTLPPSQTQKRFALAIVLVLFVCATVPFATVPLPYFREFILIELIDAMTNQKWPRILRITSAIEGPSSVVISVTDTGEGIGPNIVDRIFNPLFTTKSNGMGMGLAICRSIIEGHEGRFSASVGAQGGAVFQFVLPGDGA